MARQVNPHSLASLCTSERTRRRPARMPFSQSFMGGGSSGALERDGRLPSPAPSHGLDRIEHPVDQPALLDHDVGREGGAEPDRLVDAVGPHPCGPWGAPRRGRWMAVEGRGIDRDLARRGDRHGGRAQRRVRDHRDGAVGDAEGLERKGVVLSTTSCPTLASPTARAGTSRTTIGSAPASPMIART